MKESPRNMAANSRKKELHESQMPRREGGQIMIYWFKKHSKTFPRAWVSKGLKKSPPDFIQSAEFAYGGR